MPIIWPSARAWRACCYCGRPDFPQVALAKRQMSGFGQVVTFELEGGKEAAFRFLNALQLIKISNNLGDAKSLITHPATTTHQRLKPEATGGARHLRRHVATIPGSGSLRRYRRRH